MFTKAVYLVLSSTSFILALLPPATAKSTDPEKDRMRKDPLFQNRKNGARHTPAIVAFVSLPTALYLYSMHVAGTGSIYDSPAFMQLRELKTWHLVLTALSVGGSVLRRWSYSTLGQFFTYQLAIRPGHRLIKTGPYRYLRHPSYAGALLCFGAAFPLLLFHGLCEVTILVLSMAISKVTNTPCQLPTSILTTMGGGLWVCAMAKAISIMTTRIDIEENMLKEHFGKEWDTFASQRWRVVPFLY
ncbi:unnamed protein product [Mortierella alpina]